MKEKDLSKKTAKSVSKKKKTRPPKVPGDEEIRELESIEIPENVKKEVCQEVAEHMSNSVEEVRRLMEKPDSGILSRKLRK